MTSETDRGVPPRRTIYELVTMYELEPELRDIFVEGPRDRVLYSWYLQKCGYSDVEVSEINSIEITRETLEAYDLGNGNRARLIALAHELDSEFTSILRFVRCVADSDYDFLLDSHRHANHLLYTDYTSVDMYTYDDELLRKVLRLGFNRLEMQVKELLDSITPILIETFIVRAANEKLKWGMSLPEFTRCCKVQGSRIVFDKDVYVTRCLNKNKRRSESTTFNRVREELKAVHLDDFRKSIIGNDYFELLGWYLRKRCGWRGYARDQRSVMFILLLALDDRVLFKEGLFAKVNAVFG